MNKNIIINEVVTKGPQFQYLMNLLKKKLQYVKLSMHKIMFCSFAYNAFVHKMLETVLHEILHPFSLFSSLQTWAHSFLKKKYILRYPVLFKTAENSVRIKKLCI